MDLPSHTGSTPSLEQRIVTALQKLNDRIAGVRATRPTTSVGNDTLPAASVPGTRHFSTASNRLWVFANGEWVSADSQRWITSDAAQVSTAAGRWADLGGPSITFSIAAAGIVQVHVDVDVFAASWACVSGTCLTRAEVAMVVDGTTTVRVLSSSQYNAWVRKVSSGWADQTLSYDSEGNTYPRGAFIGLPLAAGSHTLSLRYAAINETPGPSQPATTVFFRNRVMQLLAL